MTTEQEHTGTDAAQDDDRETDPPRVDHANATVTPLRRRKEFWFWITAGTTAVLIAAALAVPLPYYVEGPGSVRPTEPRISVEGMESFDDDGTIAFTTVSQTQATPALLLRAWLDESIDVISREQALGGRSSEQDRAVNQQLMDESKIVALVVAFEAVGLDAGFTGEGAFIEETTPGLPADGVLEPGEVIVAVDGQRVQVAGDLSKALAGRPVGAAASLTVRAGVKSTDERTVDLVLGEQPDDTTRGFLGVMVSTANLRPDLPADVELDSGSVIGPSAGLAWTLGVVDRLTPGALDGGRRVVVTGTMDADGVVGPIGGLPQKTKAAKEFGADILLYPADSDAADVKRMREIAGPDLDTRPVATIDEALAVLAPDGVPQLNAST
jgi:PDZ domain-containing protein